MAGQRVALVAKTAREEPRVPTPYALLVASQSLGLRVDRDLPGSALKGMWAWNGEPNPRQPSYPRTTLSSKPSSTLTPKALPNGSLLGGMTRRWSD